MATATTRTTPAAKKTPTKAVAKPAAKRTAQPADAAAVDEVIEATIDEIEKMPTPAEIAEARQERDEAINELLADLPSLREPHRFRIAHRAAFDKLKLGFRFGDFYSDGGTLDWDLSEAAERERYERFIAHVGRIDEWAETIADDVDDYVEWSEGKTAEHFIALYTRYEVALGESSGSES